MKTRSFRRGVAALIASAMISCSLYFPASARTLGSNDTLVSGEDADGLYIEAANAVKIEGDTYYFEKEYDGEPLLPELAVQTEGASLLYGLGEGVYDLDKCPEYTGAGEYTVYAKAACEWYEQKELVLHIKINKAKNEWITEPEIDNRSVVKPFAKPRGEAKFGSVEFTFGDSPDGPFADSQPIEVGRYYMRAAVSDTSDYEGISSVDEFYVYKLSGFEYPVWFIYEYTGEPQTIEPLDFGEDYTVTYGLEDGVYDLTEPPSFTEPGRHTVYFRIEHKYGSYIEHEYDYDITEPDTEAVNGIFEYYRIVEYDGESHTIYVPRYDFLGDYTIKFGLDRENLTLDEPPSFTEPGFYRVAWSITCSGELISGNSGLYIMDNSPWTGGKLGDIDQDESFTSADALAALRISAGLEEPDEYSLALGDIDGDGEITSNDALQILRYSAGLSASETIGSVV